MFRWEKLGKLFDPGERDGLWMHAFAQSPSVVAYEDHVRVYFCTRPRPDADGMYLSYLAYIDLKEKQFYAEFERQKNGGKP